MSTDHDLAIRWNDEKSSLRRLERTGRVPIYGFPRRFRRPRGIVAIVCRANQVKLMFRATAIVGPQKVTLANGKSRSNGYVIHADMRTMREPKQSTKVPFRGWYAIGQFRYFNAATMRPVLVSDNFSSPGEYIEDLPSDTSGIVFWPHIQGIPRLPRNHPEATLVDQYVRWMGESVRFGHNYIREARLYVDLFDLTHWRLIEAKVRTSREEIRMAIGQLRDYKRYYHRRHPSLAVLLASRPSNSCIELLTDNCIAAIWRTPTGRFSMKRWQQPDE